MADSPATVFRLRAEALEAELAAAKSRIGELEQERDRLAESLREINTGVGDAADMIAEKALMGESCDTPEGRTVGLIDSLITVSRIAAERIEAYDDEIPESVIAALKDLFANSTIRFLLSFGGNAEYSTSEFRALQDNFISDLQAQLQAVQKELAAIKSPDLRKEQLVHGMNCAAWHSEHGQEINGEDCTCGLRLRIYVQTEQTLHAAWRKRAEEAEGQLAAATEASASWKSACETHAESISLLIDQKMGLTRTIDTLKEVNQELGVNTIGLERDRADLRTTAEVLSNAVQGLRKELQAVTQERDEDRIAMGYLSGYEEQCEILQDQLAAVTQERDAARKNFDDIKAVLIGNYNEPVAQLQAQLAAVSQERDHGKAERENIRVMYWRMVDVKDGTIAQLQAHNKTLRDALVSLHYNCSACRLGTRCSIGDLLALTEEAQPKT